MKNGLQMAIDTRAVLDSDTELAVLLNSGRIWLLKKPANTDRICIVVGTLALNTAQFQTGVINVNVHAPNLKDVFIDGQADDQQPDVITFAPIVERAIEVLSSFNGYDFQLAATTSGLPIQDTDGTWYINIRVEYKSFNPNFKNQ